MSTLSCGWPASARAALARLRAWLSVSTAVSKAVCTSVCISVGVSASFMASPAYAAHAQKPAEPPEAVPSQLLSDDERIDFCTQMRHAATPEQRRVVAARLHDTLTPRAQVQGVDLPAWVKEGQPAGGGRLPGLSCDSGAARTHAPAPAPVPAPVPAQSNAQLRAQANAQAAEAAARKSAAREAVEPKATPPREVANHAAAQPVEVPVREPAGQTTAAIAPPPATPDIEAPPGIPPPSRSAAAADIPVEQDHGIAYVTGGVGQDEASAMRGLATGYNMRATFTTRSGEYLSGIRVQVLRADGTTAFAATTDGPYLFARLPQGHYRVIASLDGSERSRELYVPSHGGVRFTLVWPSLGTASAN
jgi:hypothetical protein